MTIPNGIFAQMAPVPYETARAEVRSGDLLFCSAHDPGSRAIRWATRSAWSHVAIAFRIRDIDRVLALECVEKLGVRAVPLSDFITRTSSGQTPYPGRILLARNATLAARADAADIERMSGFAFDRLGSRFSTREVAKIALRIVAGRLNTRLPRTMQADDEFICSEYVARCFERIGLPVPWDGLGFIAPSDIADDPAVHPVLQIQTR